MGTDEDQGQVARISGQPQDLDNDRNLSVRPWK
jgi:hypothetical protein